VAVAAWALEGAEGVPFDAIVILAIIVLNGQDRRPRRGSPDPLRARGRGPVAGVVVPLSAQRRAEVLATVDRLAGRALRTLAVAYRPLPAGTTADETVERELIYLGRVGIIDPPRPEAAAAVAEAGAAGVRLLMITGDHPRTAIRIAGDLGIVGPGAGALAGPEIEALDNEALRAAMQNVSASVVLWADELRKLVARRSRSRPAGEPAGV
jgi:magnesium-transporting ATPase (P-type)